MTKTQKQLQGEQTRQHIIEEAAKLFARKGFYGTSISDLAQATELTKGAFYHHFENKEALFFAVIDMVRSTWHEAVIRDVLKVKDALPRISILFDNHTRLVSENETLCLVLSTLAEEMDGVNPIYMATLQEIYADMTYFIGRIIQKGQAANQVRSDLDAQLMAVNIVGMLKGVGCSQILNQLSVDHAARMATLKQMLLDSLRP
ncbi:MAG: TetR/AcrR family transcriptional regulator [Anaerolineae bacterium]|jgi:TetR/AcrR family transcriptional repressor of nem operon|nr:TetR/AcrR family transcriptional regulator [Anaerolineae bacterium]